MFCTYFKLYIYRDALAELVMSNVILLSHRKIYRIVGRVLYSTFLMKFPDDTEEINNPKIEQLHFHTSKTCNLKLTAFGIFHKISIKDYPQSNRYRVQ
jgi:hypothetical protein